MDQQIAIREALEQDAAGISDLIRNTIRISNANDYPASVIERVVQGFTAAAVLELLAQRITLVAEAGDQIIGTAALDGETVRSVFVSPDAQGRGVGSRLMAGIESIALRNGTGALQVPASLTAAPFYRRLGYHELREAFHGEERTIVMLKTLV